MRLRRPGLRAALSAMALALAGCAAERPKPTPLVPIEARISGQVAWQAGVGEIGFPLVLWAGADRFIAAGGDGTVLALDAASGRELWRTGAGARLTAGVGSDGRFAAVVTVDNALVVFDQGREVWRRTLPARVVTAPLVAGERVFVLRVDRAVQAFDVLDGRPLWSYSRPGDALTLSQAGLIAPYGNLLLAGQGPRLAALDPLRGSLRWEVAIATPRGTNEVERLADLVGPVARSGDWVCARSFQAAVGCVDASRPSLLWSRPNAGAQALGGDAELLIGADAAGRLTAWRTPSGEVAWTNETLAHRELSGTLLVGAVAVVGDLEGQVHFLSRESGEVQLRLPTDGTAVIGRPALSGTTVLVATRGGGLFALRP